MYRVSGEIISQIVSLLNKIKKICLFFLKRSGLASETIQGMLS